jgi:asparagine synthase (glutamine-hydrolysing)
VSLLFGMWNLDGRPVDPECVTRIMRTVEREAPDGFTIFVEGTVFMLHGASHTTEESRRERQPYSSLSGAFLMWDGRLDNGTGLRTDLDSCGPNDTALQIVSSLWERDGTHCLRNLIGDWAVAVFNRYERTLVLAKDFLGVRPLYYLRCDHYVAWSSLLTPLIALAGKVTLCDEYVAGWLGGFPEAHLTPYREIHAVSPASFVRITRQSIHVERYWDFRPQPVRLRSDVEYEEQFRTLFFNSVRRRLRSDTPVLAELSGGMDSSAIVCSADRLVATEGAAPVETVSLFDDNEPNWNERPFFTAVEAQRGRSGFHLDVASDGRLLPERDGGFPPTPAHGARPSAPQRHFSQFLAERGFRVLLSGIGGDEFTGGVPTAIPELADLIREGRFVALLQSSFQWSLASRKPLLQTLKRTVRSFLPTLRASRSRTQWPMPWVKPSFLKRNRRALAAPAARYHVFGPLPTFQENLHALAGLRQQIACAEMSPSPSCEKRYPFLDRDLLEFLFNVPREQLVRPNQRRSLLRRAMQGIVADVVLNRPRKAFVATSQLKAIAADWTRITRLIETMSLESRGLIDSKIIARTLDEARSGREIPLLSLTRVLRLEWWLQDPAIRRLFDRSPGADLGSLRLCLRTGAHLEIK